MREAIVEATIAALSSVINPRFFKSEREYQGGFYCGLLAELENRNLLTEDRIVEMEYQKRSAKHGLSQRPDIIFHIPTELSGADVADNNYAVWAFKANAGPEAAQEDFEKLNQMFGGLNYPLGFFINIRTGQHCLQHYNGPFRDRLFGFAVWLQNGMPRIKEAWYEDTELMEQVL